MDKQVSFDDEPLILVNGNDDEIGGLDKESCHVQGGKLHRAFSIFISNSEGKVLLQKRSEQKKLWPNFWSNSCCSHPRRGELILDAAHRRLEEELNLHSELTKVYQFEYKAHYLNIGTEHELCTVYVGTSNEEAVVNKNEVSDLCWLYPQEIDQLMINQEELVTPWFQMEWEVLRNTYPNSLEK